MTFQSIENQYGIVERERESYWLVLSQRCQQQYFRGHIMDFVFKTPDRMLDSTILVI